MGLLRCWAIIALNLLVSAIMAQEDNQYERSSLHTMLLTHHEQGYEDIVKEVFNEAPFPDRFNNHNLGVKSVAFAGVHEDQSSNIQNFCIQVNLGQKMVAKWFNRDKITGRMNMELIKERGLYNASQAQVNTARSSMRGLALLADAGETLIKNTYLVVSDIQYESVGNGLGFLGNLLTPKKLKEFDKYYSNGKGFKVVVTSYLYRLKWNEEMADEFYSMYYTENGNDKKAESFIADGKKWQMEYAGKTVSSFQKQNSKETAATPRRMLLKVTTRALDKNLAQLQHNYPDFRIKAPLTSVEPLKVYVGLKEDITPQSRFEVLERVIDKEGRLSYRRVGVIKPKADHIWDNRYMADDEDADARLGYTEFEKVSGGEMLPGMLIREIESE